MDLLNKKRLVDSIESSELDTIYIEPLLDTDQIGEVTVDLRLGYDFQVAILTRKPSVDLSFRENSRRSIASYFDETRRDLGQTFVLYPGQVVISTTLEYVALPNNVYMDIITRSSYNRLGIHLNTMVQPGWRGTVPLELFNHGSTPIELVVGCRLVQARFFESSEADYLSESRKYHADVRPTISRADRDSDLTRLALIRDSSE